MFNHEKAALALCSGIKVTGCHTEHVSLLLFPGLFFFFTLPGGFERFVLWASTRLHLINFFKRFAVLVAFLSPGMHSSSWPLFSKNPSPFYRPVVLELGPPGVLGLLLPEALASPASGEGS